MYPTRRKFLKKSLLATTGTMLIPHFLKAFEGVEQGTNQTGKKLIIIQLSGGNDGLNTIIPFRNDLYYQQRPQLAIGADRVLKASDELGFNPSLIGLHELYDQGYLAVLNNVGYPNPDRSHFRSMDIWQSASNANEYIQTGWLGRYLDAKCQDCMAAHHAIEIDDTLSLALKGEQVKGMALTQPKRLYDAVRNNFFQQLYSKNEIPDQQSNPALHYLYKTMAETVSSADYIYQKTQVAKSQTSYPNTEFGNHLKTVAQFIASGIETEVYYVSLSGFDTHVRQSQIHERLLGIYADGVKAFVQDLDKNGLLDDVLILTFSEFGRRVSENASGGTDHGTANNLFLISKSLKQKGFLNETPDLSQLDQGDLIHTIDFRTVYATILKKWLAADDQRILGYSFKLLDFV